MSTEQSPFGNEQRRRITVPFRPLNRGIVRNISPTLTPVGAFYNADGFYPADQGLTRRDAFTTLSLTFPDIVKWQYLDSFIDDLGVKITYGIGDGVLYELAGSSFSARPCEYAAGTVTGVAGTKVITLDTAPTDTFKTIGSVVRGDKITITDTGEVYTVSTVTDDIIVIFEGEIVTAFTTSAYKIERLLTPASDWTITTVRLDRYIVICTGKNPLMIYDIDKADLVRTFAEQAIADSIPGISPNPFIPKTIEVFNDRFWIGNVYSDDKARWYPSRISWSPILSPLALDPDALFRDEVTIGGEIGCIKSLGNLLAVYFEFGILYGRETSVPGDTLPLAFDKLETARRGVLQPGAVASARGGHFYVSTDNVYFLSEGLESTTLAEEPSEDMFRPSLLRTRYIAKNFISAQGIVIGASSKDDSIEELWLFNFSTRAWTKLSVSCDTFSSFALGSRLIYDEYPPNLLYGDDYTPYPPPQPILPPEPLPPGYSVWDFTDEGIAYGAVTVVSEEESLFITTGKNIHGLDTSSTIDYAGQQIIVLIDTGDFDFGRPDNYKTLYKLGLRIDEQAPADIVFHIQGSLDSGLTWSDLGNLTIYQGGKEGKCNFLFTGSAPRLRLTSDSEVTSYTINELTLGVKGRGKQFADY